MIPMPAISTNRIGSAGPSASTIYAWPGIGMIAAVCATPADESAGPTAMHAGAAYPAGSAAGAGIHECYETSWHITCSFCGLSPGTGLSHSRPSRLDGRVSHQHRAKPMPIQITGPTYLVGMLRVDVCTVDCDGIIGCGTCGEGVLLSTTVASALMVFIVSMRG